MWVLLLLCAGALLVMANELAAVRRTRVEYRYLPRDLDTYLREEPHAAATFRAMWDGSDPWNEREIKQIAGRAAPKPAAATPRPPVAAAPKPAPPAARR